jgi:methyl-accepting chemotaxis protein
MTQIKKNVAFLYTAILGLGLLAGLVFPMVASRWLHKPALFTFASCVMGVLLASAILFVVRRIILKPLVELTWAMEQVSQGNLKVQMTGEFAQETRELVTNFNRMLDYLRSSVVQMKKSSNETLQLAQQLTQTIQQMHGSTEEVSSTIQNISKGAEEQASKVQEAFNIIDRMAGSIQTSAEQLNSAEKAVQGSKTASEDGTQAVQRTIAHMNSIHEVVQNSSREVNELGSRSKAIGQVVDVITHIADQTNLLALNAAIEAARAGEYGRGFAVVAEEVKKLADGSAEAANQISSMIREIQKEIDAVVTSMNKGAERVTQGLAVVASAGESLHEIQSASDEVASQVQQISQSFESQADQAGKVVEAITNIVAVSEENASSTEEISASTEELTASMEALVAAARQLEGVAQRLKESSSNFRD